MAETILPLAKRALGNLQDMGGTVRLSPLCHEGPKHEVRGWVMEVPGTEHASKLPVPHNLFHGVSIALCDASEEEILGLMRDADGTRAAIAAAVDRLMAKNKRKAAWKRCRPREVPPSLFAAQRDKEGGITFLPDAPAVIDGEPWDPEISQDGFVGLFFRWHAGESRLHLYAACQSYLPKACLDFSTLVHCAIDDEKCTADMVCLSEEAQWLRAACERNRARVIAEICADMKVRVPTVQDYRAADQPPIALTTTETLHHDIIYAPGANVRVLNYCSDARSAFNGSLCVMSPWDGLWVFRGAAGGGNMFGLPHGKAGVVLPTASPRVHKPYGGLAFTSANTQQCKALRVWGGKPTHIEYTMQPEPIFARRENITDPDALAAYNTIMARRALPMTVSVPNVPGLVETETKQHYLEFDEHVLDRMAKLGWDRSHGVAKLMPLACALYEHWKG